MQRKDFFSLICITSVSFVMEEQKEGPIGAKEYGDTYRVDFLSMYHQYAATAERISERRGNANTFFVTANAALLGATGYLPESLEGLWMPAIAGILMCIIWHGFFPKKEP